jgi:DNA-binding transcriptional LysR family regulator
MPRLEADSDSYIGRRIKLRDLQILRAVAQHGSMAKAATHLATAQPTVSQAIAELEDATGVRLFDRSTRGVALTEYGEILLKSTGESFDALQQALRRIEYLATTGAGDVWIGCAELMFYGFVPTVIQRLARHYPKIVVHAAQANPAENELLRLRDRTFDLMIGRPAPGQVREDLSSEKLFDEAFTVVTGTDNPWARRRKVALAELMNESWIFGELDNATQRAISAIFDSKGLGLPPISLYTTAMNLRLALLETGHYISCVPASIYRYGRRARRLKALPIDMRLKLPIALYTLKNRSLTPAAQIFIEQARLVAAEMRKEK